MYPFVCAITPWSALAVLTIICTYCIWRLTREYRVFGDPRRTARMVAASSGLLLVTTALLIVILLHAASPTLLLLLLIVATALNALRAAEFDQEDVIRPSSLFLDAEIRPRPHPDL